MENLFQLLLRNGKRYAWKLRPHDKETNLRWSESTNDTVRLKRRFDSETIAIVNVLGIESRSRRLILTAQ
jgi:hypothetical protein